MLIFIILTKDVIQKSDLFAFWFQIVKMYSEKLKTEIMPVFPSISSRFNASSGVCVKVAQLTQKARQNRNLIIVLIGNQFDALALS